MREMYHIPRCNRSASSAEQADLPDDGRWNPANILEAVDRGVDSLTVFTRPATDALQSCIHENHGKLNLLNQKYELDPSPIEEGRQCPACRSIPGAYIRHLFKAKEMPECVCASCIICILYNKMMEEDPRRDRTAPVRRVQGPEACRYGGRPAGIVS